MTMRWALAAVHLLALGIGLGAVWARARALRGGAPDAARLRQALTADAWWGIAALLWLVTGLWRLFAGTEKATAYYMGSGLFWLKMGLFGLVFALELVPMATLAGWRRRLGSGESPDLRRADAIARISVAQAALVVAIVLAATGMARGYGAGP